MTKRARLLAQHGSASAVLLVILLLLIPAQIGVVMNVGRVVPQRAAADLATPVDAAPTVSVLPTIHRKTPTKKTAVDTPAKKRLDLAAPFRGLGAWIDVYDFDIDVADAVKTMARNDVRTLYIQTGRYNTPKPVAPEVGPWLVAAHEAGLDVVGWYLPGYKDVAHDVNWTVAAARYRFKGHRFDAIGIDVEFRGLVPKPKPWNKAVVRHSAAVRKALGKRYPIGAIVFPPVDMTVAPGHWKGFPWEALGRNSDAFLVMGYWSNRDCPKVKLHCPYRYTLENAIRARAGAGRAIPIHLIGGIGDQISAKGLKAFARASRDAGAIGASLYDFRTTARSFWSILRGMQWS